MASTDQFQSSMHDAFNTLGVVDPQQAAMHYNQQQMAHRQAQASQLDHSPVPPMHTYHVLENYSLSLLARDVNNWINNHGYTPLGGVVVTSNQYIQTMYRPPQPIQF